MLVSTRGRYAIRVLLDLVEHIDDGYIPMKSISERQGLSLKYMEQIMPILSKNGLVDGIHGKGGGYKLSRKPQDYTVGEVLRLTEGNIAPVACLACDAEKCSKENICKTLPMWKEFYKLSTDFFDGITLKELSEGYGTNNGK